jgi:hypothetical protein
MIVKITKDAKKLFSCPEFAKNHTDFKGELPPASGREISITLPGRQSNFCSAMIWQVAPDQSKALDRKHRPDAFVCEHQIDFRNTREEKIAKGE